MKRRHRLGHGQIVEPLGTGGNGEVWRRSAAAEREAVR